MSEQIDYKKQYKEFYNPSKKNPEIVNIPEFKFLMIDGEDAREESINFQNAIQALFNVSYKTKFYFRNEKNITYKVMPLEGLWWADDMSDFEKYNKEKWKWTLMIMQPDFVTKKEISNSIEITKKKKDNIAIDLLYLKSFKEGPSCQIMHLGPYSEEHGNIMKLHNHIKENSGTYDGQIQKHHEIYISDFRRCAPEKLKTVLRQPFVPAK